MRQLQVSNWFGFNEGPGGSVGNVTLVPGPSTPPSGTGSAELQVDSTGRASLGTNAFKGTPLSQITGMDYWGFVVGGTTNQLVLEFDVTYDTTQSSTAYQGRLVFVPSTPPPADAWRHLNALTDGTWYASRAPGDASCSQSTPCSWSTVLSDFPHAAIRNDPIEQGALLLRLGGPITGGATAYVDDLTVATTTTTTTTDFEPGGSITPSIGPAGTNVTAHGFGFRPNAKVTVKYKAGARPHPIVTLCSSRADATGAVLCTGTVPSRAGSAGAHTVTLKGRGPKGGPRTITYSDDFVLSN
ncbi:MAG TPA: hypothetical protein VKU86_09135 [Acidimicrobiales bacterium]|nr:hypothetical protein [Acidimicrobiales bacterium]